MDVVAVVRRDDDLLLKVNRPPDVAVAADHINGAPVEEIIDRMAARDVAIIILSTSVTYENLTISLASEATG